MINSSSVSINNNTQKSKLKNNFGVRDLINSPEKLILEELDKAEKNGFSSTANDTFEKKDEKRKKSLIIGLALCSLGVATYLIDRRVNGKSAEGFWRHLFCGPTIKKL